jgi:Protein of unknown function (DUF2630)
MDDAEILSQIHNLVEEEKTLRADHRSEGLRGQDRSRLEQIEEQLDRAWDLLRQRRAREEFDENPGEAKERPTNEVEGYLQ